MEPNSSATASPASTNSSSELILMVPMFQGLPGVKYAFFTALVLIYSFSVSANATLALLIVLDRNLHKPMYVLMALLALTDVVETTNILPRIMSNLVAWNYMSMAECIAQMFFVHIGIRLQSFILTTMSVDRYVAVVHPLRYHAIISNSLVFKVFLLSLAVAGLPIFGYVAVVVRLDYCKVMVTYSPNCDITIISSLSCGDLYPSVIYTYVNIVTGIVLPLLLVVAMYVLIFADLHRKGRSSSTSSSTSSTTSSTSSSGQQQHQQGSGSKAVHTCMSHLFVVSVFFTFIVFTFLNGLRLYTIPRDVRFPLQTLQYVLPPALNPVVYGLRTAQIRRRLAGLLGGRVGPAADRQ